jgi:hypothetical protein
VYHDSSISPFQLLAVLLDLILWHRMHICHPLLSSLLAGTSRLAAPDHSAIHAVCSRHSELVRVLRELEPDGRSVAKLHQAYGQAVNMLIRCVPGLLGGIYSTLHPLCSVYTGVISAEVWSGGEHACQVSVGHGRHQLTPI